MVGVIPDCFPGVVGLAGGHQGKYQVVLKDDVIQVVYFVLPGLTLVVTDHCDGLVILPS